MGGFGGFHAHVARRQLRNKRSHLPVRQAFGEDYMGARIDAMPLTHKHGHI
jgi:hypothetical protein